MLRNTPYFPGEIPDIPAMHALDKCLRIWDMEPVVHSCSRRFSIGRLLEIAGGKCFRNIRALRMDAQPSGSGRCQVDSVTDPFRNHK